jgi:hypothetical protein
LYNNKEEIMKKQKLSQAHSPASAMGRTIQKMRLAPESPKRERTLDIPPPAHFDEILSPSWAWRMLHKS